VVLGLADDVLIIAIAEGVAGVVVCMMDVV